MRICVLLFKSLYDKLKLRSVVFYIIFLFFQEEFCIKKLPELYFFRLYLQRKIFPFGYITNNTKKLNNIKI